MARLKTLTGLLLLLLAAGCLGKAFWIDAKAIVAQWLISSAWQETLASGHPVKPWEWADTWPAAMLVTPTGKRLYVMYSVSGQALAFGPGMMAESTAPGAVGNTVIAGHRDTHFNFLEHTLIGDKISVQDNKGVFHHYQVQSANIVDVRKSELILQQSHAELVLITCYPFNAINPGGPLRYVLHATPVKKTST